MRRRTLLFVSTSCNGRARYGVATLFVGTDLRGDWTYFPSSYPFLWTFEYCYEQMHFRSVKAPAFHTRFRRRSTFRSLYLCLHQRLPTLLPSYTSQKKRNSLSTTTRITTGSGRKMNDQTNTNGGDRSFVCAVIRNGQEKSYSPWMLFVTNNIHRE